MTHFRKRFTAESLQEINRRIFPDEDAPQDDDDPPEEDDDDKKRRNRGSLILDATVSPADMTFTADSKLLNGSRECLEGIMDALRELRPPGSTKPGTYRENVRRDYLRVRTDPGVRK